MTRDRAAIQRTLDRMSIAPEPPNQGTNIGSALGLIETRDTTTNKLAFIISDGCENTPLMDTTRARVRELKTHGVEVFIVYIPSGGEQCPSFLQELASDPLESHYFPIIHQPYFDQITRPDFIDNLLSKSCLQINSIRPSIVCNSTRRTFTVTGRGFLQTDDLSSFKCKFEPHCSDVVGWTDASGNGCQFYAENQQYCHGQYALVQKFCPKACEVCPNIDTICQDDPMYAAQCNTWAASGQCRTSEEFMMVHCARTCGGCNTHSAYVVSDTELLCESPSLRAVATFSFEVTKNGMTWTEGHSTISTYDCKGAEQDDPLLTDLNNFLSLQLQSSPYFARDRSTLQLNFTVSNIGHLAITGPIRIVSREFDYGQALCPTQGSLEPGFLVSCTGYRTLSSADLTTGQITVKAYAEGVVAHGLLAKSQEKTSDLYGAWTFTAPPTTSRPTNGPTDEPTNFPTPAPTPLPTRQPTFKPTARPTRFIFAPTPPILEPTPFPTKPTSRPTAPTKFPTPFPTLDPTTQPTVQVTASPSHGPSPHPTTASAVENPTTGPLPDPTSDVGGVLNASTCPSWLDHIGCVPWYVWVILALLVLIIILIVCVLYGRPKPAQYDPGMSPVAISGPMPTPSHDPLIHNKYNNDPFASPPSMTPIRPPPMDPRRTASRSDAEVQFKYSGDTLSNRQARSASDRSSDEEPTFHYKYQEASMH